MSQESLQWLDSIGFDYDRSLAEAMLTAQDWTVFGSKLEARRSASCATHPGLQEILIAKDLEFVEAVALVCADKKYFPTRRELWLQRAKEWKTDLLAALQECDAQRFDNTSVIDDEVVEEVQDWKERMTTMESDLEDFFREMDQLFPRKLSDTDRELHAAAIPLRAELSDIFQELKKEFHLISGEKKRRPMLIKVGVGVLIVAGIVAWRVIKWSKKE